MSPRLKYKDYTVAWIAILPVEAEAALRSLDCRHDGLFASDTGDDYLYIGGEVNGHNVVIATLPAGHGYGIGAAAALASHIKTHFVNLWFALLVGVAAGLPNLSLDEPTKYRDIRLGDVLISEPGESGAGIIHYDLGRDTEDGFRVKGQLDRSPPILRSAFGRMKLLYEHPYKEGNIVATYLRSLQEIDGGPKFTCPDSKTDRLFASSQGAEQAKEIHREPRSGQERTLVWYGNIGSGNSLMRNARHRDELRDRYDLIGLEMEAAGVVNILPSGIIRGVCDYGDRYKTKEWQPYAAAVAAAYAKAALNFIQPRKAGSKRKYRDFQDSSDQASSLNKEDQDVLASFAFAQMKDRRLNIHQPHEGTCRWILNLPQYREWDAQPQGLLWIKGKPGAGKSTLMSFLYSVIGEKAIKGSTIYLEFFFNARGSALQSNLTGMLRSLLNQIYYQDLQSRPFIKKLYKERQIPFGGSSRTWEWQPQELMFVFESVISQSVQDRHWLIFIDALDEAGEESALAIADFFHRINVKLGLMGKVAKIYISCRHYPFTPQGYSTEICVEDHNHDDIQVYVETHIDRALSQVCHLSNNRQWQQLATDVVRQARGSFQWISLVLPIVMRSIRNGFSTMQTRRQLEKVPKELSDVYKHILSNVIDQDTIEQSYLLFQWICLAERPLSLTELRFALAAYHASPSSTQISEFPWQETEGFIESDLAMKIQLRALSGGLLEAANDIVQVVHHTVREFLVRDGLILLESITINCNRSTTQSDWTETSLESANIVFRCHAQIYWSCLKYLVVEQSVILQAKASQKSPEAVSPLVDYAGSFIFWHAKKAKHYHQASVSAQLRLISRIISLWENLVEHFHWTDPFVMFGYKNIQMLHVAAAFDLSHLMHHLIGCGVKLNERETLVGFTALHFAAWRGHEDAALTLLAAGAEVDLGDNEGRTPLYTAAHWGHRSIVSLLLTHQAAVDVPKDTGKTALMAASGMDRESVVQLLLAHHANINTQRRTGSTALILAAQQGLHRIVRILLKYQAEADIQDMAGNTALIAAATGKWPRASTSYEQTVETLLNHGVNVNLRNAEGNTALSMATTVGRRIQVSRLLLEHGADVNIENNVGNTALIRLCNWGHKYESGVESRGQTAELLLKHGAHVNVQNRKGHTALALASMMGDKEIVRIFLRHGADVNIQNQNGDTALVHASAKGHELVVALLLQHAADVDIQNHVGETALMIAAMKGHENIVRLLVRHEADVDIVNNEGYTAFEMRLNCRYEQWMDLLNPNRAYQNDHQDNCQGVSDDFPGEMEWITSPVEDHVHEAEQYLAFQSDYGIQIESGETKLTCASKNGYEDVVRFLLEAQYDVNEAERSGDTALMWASQRGHMLIVQMLLDSKAEVNARNDCGETALMMASGRGDFSTVNLLLDHGADRSAESQSGETALQWALTCGHEDVVKLLS